MRFAPLAFVAVGILVGFGMEAGATRVPVPSFETFELTIGPVVDFGMEGEPSINVEDMRGTYVRISGSSRPYELTISFWGKDYIVPPEVARKLPHNLTGLEFAAGRHEPETGNSMFLRFTDGVLAEDLFNEHRGGAETGIIRISEKRGVELMSSDVER